MTSTTLTQTVSVQGRPCCAACRQPLPEPYVYLSPTERRMYNAIKLHSPNYTKLKLLMGSSCKSMNSLSTILNTLRGRLLLSDFDIPVIRKGQVLRVVNRNLVKEKNRASVPYLKSI